MTDAVRSYPFGPPVRLDMDPTYAKLRDGEPLARIALPFGGEAWLATRYDDVRTVLSDRRFSRAAVVGKEVPRVMPNLERESLLSMDPPEHTRLRRLTASAFTARRIEALRPRVQAIVDELLDRMVAAGPRGDLADSLAWPLPITVICEVLGVPLADRDRFRTLTDQVLSLAPGDGAAILAAQEGLIAYLSELIAQRRANPTDDMLGMLVAARDEEDRLSEDELVMFGIALLVAGHETTANQLGNMVYVLLHDRPLWDRLVADPDVVRAAVEELSRFIPLGAVASLPRIATEDVTFGDVTVRAGDAILVQMAAANRDKSVFDRPDEIDLDRAENPHVAFGHGAHHCLGAPLARLELQVALGTLVRRLPGLRLDVAADDVAWRVDRLVRGVRALPVTW